MKFMSKILLLLSLSVTGLAQDNFASAGASLAVVRFREPLLSADAASGERNVFNPTVIVVGNKLAMLYRADINGVHGSQIRLAFSEDGRSFKRSETNPVLAGDAPFDIRGCEDPRVVKFGHVFYMTYVCNASSGPQRQCLATSTDLIHWNKQGVIFTATKTWDSSQSKAAVIVPVKVRGKYVMYFTGQTTPWQTSIGIATSKDLHHWSEPKDVPILSPRADHFDSLGVESGATPIILPSGILLIYNGWNAQHVHETGWVLLSRKDPAHVISRSDRSFIRPQYPFEINGRDAFTFTEGAIFFKGLWRFYYGAADRTIGVAEVKELTELMRDDAER